uniref:Uncharacterized protein n=1 Tax=Trichuris muris TaxID=70415 RepID=A0A5S6QQP1_TRIMR
MFKAGNGLDKSRHYGSYEKTSERKWCAKIRATGAAKLSQLSNPESSQITVEDLRLARQLQCETSRQRVGFDELLDKLAEEKNSIPLPTLKSNKGVALPPERHCLLMQNYRLRIGPTAQYSAQHAGRSASLDGPRKLLQNAPHSMARYHGSSSAIPAAAGSSQNDGVLRAEQPGLDLNQDSCSADAEDFSCPVIRDKECDGDFERLLPISLVSYEK